MKKIDGKKEKKMDRKTDKIISRHQTDKKFFLHFL